MYDQEDPGVKNMRKIMQSDWLKKFMPVKVPASIFEEQIYCGIDRAYQQPSKICEVQMFLKEIMEANNCQITTHDSVELCNAGLAPKYIVIKRLKDLKYSYLNLSL